MRCQFAGSAGHFEDELAGGDVPEGDAGLDVGIEASTSGVGHAEGGTAHHAHFATAEGGFAKAFEADFEGFFVFAAADEDDGFFELGAGADAEGLAVEEDFAAFFCGPSFAGHWVVDDACEDIFALAHGDGDAEVGDAVEEVDGAIDGVDDPLAVGVLITAEAFFAIEGVVGEVGGDASEDEVLGLAVELELEVVMEGLIDGLVLVEVVAEKLACFLGGAECGFEIGHSEDLAAKCDFEKNGQGKIS